MIIFCIIKNKLFKKKKKTFIKNEFFKNIYLFYDYLVECPVGYYHDPKSVGEPCKKCLEGCNNCSDFNSCDFCKSGFFKNKESHCEACM